MLVDQAGPLGQTVDKGLRGELRGKGILVGVDACLAGRVGFRPGGVKAPLLLEMMTRSSDVVRSSRFYPTLIFMAPFCGILNRRLFVR